MNLGLTLGIGSRSGGGGAPGFTPAALFALGEEGVWFAPSPTTCFTDTARTIPAVVGNAVAGMTDLSGNGNHAVQGTAGAAPILRLDGVTGSYYLEFDGTNDRIVAPYAGTATFTRTTVLHQQAWALNRHFYGSLVGAPELRQRPSTPGIGIAATSVLADTTELAIGVTGIVAEKIIDVTSASIQVNNGTVVTDAVVGAITAPLEISMGGRSDGTLPVNGRVYECVVRNGTLSVDDGAALKAYLAAEHGVTL